MGNSVSSPGTDVASNEKSHKICTKAEVLKLWRNQSRKLVMTAVAVKQLQAKLNVTELEDQPIARADLCGLVRLPTPTKEHPAGYNIAVGLLVDMCKIMGCFPFVKSDPAQTLTVDCLIVSMFFHSQLFKRILPQYDYLTLLFICLSRYADAGTVLHDLEKPRPGDASVTVGITDTGKVQWQFLHCVKHYDDIDFQGLHVRKSDLIHMVALLLAVTLASATKGESSFMEELATRIKIWHEFEHCASAMVRFIDMLTSKPTINLESFKLGVEGGFPRLFEMGFQVIFQGWCQPARTNAAERTASILTAKLLPKFTPSRLMSYPTFALFASILGKTGFQITPQNTVKLYSGAESGFLIRSLELKIFKWQAPTIFLVSGKRLRKKTIASNKRYQQFTEEYPRFFRTSEEATKPWQRDSDRITYAVIVSQPWRVSNKKNFGDDMCTIISLVPHFDIYKSVTNPILKGELVYFNTLGMGIGFGNDQSINKSGVKKYLPGDTSLTIEANLEFAIFRHIVTPTSNPRRYFHKSQQLQLQHEDFEDRFMVTNLEVWGVGSTKELEEQKRLWEWEAKQAEARRSVNLKNTGEERAFLEMVGLVGNHGGGGSI